MKKSFISVILILSLFFVSSCSNYDIGCTKEAKLCPDGSAVGRTPPNCEFAPCAEVKDYTQIENEKVSRECNKDSDCELVKIDSFYCCTQSCEIDIGLEYDAKSAALNYSSYIAVKELKCNAEKCGTELICETIDLGIGPFNYSAKCVNNTCQKMSKQTVSLTKNWLDCRPDQRGLDKACTQIYEPVCALRVNPCLVTPCPEVYQTYSNSCRACLDSDVTGYYRGECSHVESLT